MQQQTASSCRQEQSNQQHSQEIDLRLGRETASCLYREEKLQIFHAQVSDLALVDVGDQTCSPVSCRATCCWVTWLQAIHEFTECAAILERLLHSAFHWITRNTPDPLEHLYIPHLTVQPADAGQGTLADYARAEQWSCIQEGEGGEMLMLHYCAGKGVVHCTQRHGREESKCWQLTSDHHLGSMRDADWYISIPSERESTAIAPVCVCAACLSH